MASVVKHQGPQPVKDKIIKAHKDGEDFYQIREDSWSKEDNSPWDRKYAGTRYPKPDGDALAFSVTCLEENPLLSLEDLLYKIGLQFLEKPNLPAKHWPEHLKGNL